MPEDAITPERHTNAPSSAVTAQVLRDSTVEDMDTIQGIYAHHVRTGLASFELVPPSVAEMENRRATILAHGLPHIVAELDGKVVGYAYAGPYRPRPAYRHTIEDSVYVALAFGGRRIGTALLSDLIVRCERGIWRQMIAVIGDSDNLGSIALHRRLGFQQTGVLQAVGYKFGRWVDSVIMQRMLGTGDTSAPTQS